MAKISDKKNKNSFLSLIIGQKISKKKCKKLFIFELVRQVKQVKILCSIAIKLLTEEVTKLCVILMNI